MGLDLSKLENIRHHGAKVIARCPACAEAGNDRKAEHLFIEPGGRFGCVVFPGQDGRKHRQRIFELAGIKTGAPSGFKIRKPSSSVSEQKTVQKNILGRLGHIKSTHARKNLENHLCENEDNPQNDCPDADPSVPNLEPPNLSKSIFSPEEERLLTGIDAESLEKVRIIKNIFNGTVVAVEDNNCGANKEPLR